MKHEEFIHRIADLAIARLPENERGAMAAKIVYGMGAGTGARGVCYYSSWKNGLPQPIPIVEICAAAEESAVQVAGTTIHELGHVLAGPGAGHDNAWKAACERLGLRRAKAAGMIYTLAAFPWEIRVEIEKALLIDGAPVRSGSLVPGTPRILTPRPCGLGIGTKGGTSRGTGSGSRLRKFTCDCNPPVIIRAARDVLAAHCDLCSGAFKREGE